MWKDILRGILLGVVQGLTEFLPVSSSGHLLLLERMGVASPSLLLNLLLHVATLAAVVLIMHRDVGEWLRHPLCKRARWLYLVCVPTAVIAGLLMVFARDVLSGDLLPLGFLATSCLLFWGARIPQRQRPLTPANALLTGVAHGIAALPGLSRSGTTISVMRMLGIEGDDAVRLSFLMSIPVIIGGAMVECIGADWGAVNPPLYIAATLSAFASGLLGLRVMLNAFRGAMPLFGFYTLALSVFSLFV
jgi:undecaprenyl-diphosphatase